MPIYDYYNTGDNSYLSTITGIWWAAQTFTSALTYSITKVNLKLFRTGNPNTITVSIRATSGGDPVAPDLAVGTTDGNTLTGGTSGEWREITFTTPYTLTAGTQYAIVVRCAPTGGHSLGWRLDNTNPTYPGGCREYSTDSGSTWTATATNDFMFECWGVGTTTVPVDLTHEKMLVSVGNYEVWYESTAGTKSELSAANGILDVANRKLNMFEAYGKVFFVNEDLKYVADFINIKLTTADIKPAGKVIPLHNDLLTGGTSGAQMIVDYIDASDGTCTVYGRNITSGTFVNGETVTGTNDNGDISFTLNADEVAGPHWYEWTVYANDTTTYGELPAKPTLGCLFIGRAVLAGDLNDPNQWYMSRQENIWDWNFGATDAQAPVSGEDADAGKCGDIITALIPYSRDYLLFGCANSCWLMEGNPMENGVLDVFDDTTGIYGFKAWCFDNDGNLYFWGNNGIYKSIIPGHPICISQNSLPNIVKDEAVDPSVHRIVFGFDPEHNGIIIAITKLSDGTNSNYWYDLATEGFFPESYPDECGIFSMFNYAATDPDYRKLALGCNNGYLQIFSDDAKDDDKGSTDQAIDSYVSWGPLLMAEDPTLTGKIIRLILITAGGASGGSQSDSDDVRCAIFLGKSAEEVIEKIVANTNPTFYKVIQAPGRQHGGIVKRKLRSVYSGIRIGNNTSGETWALEQILVDAKTSGRFK